MESTDSKITDSTSRIREILYQNREKSTERFSFFNRIIPGCKNPLAVKTPILLKIVRIFWKEYQGNLEGYLTLCDNLWFKTEYYEEKKVAILLLEKLVTRHPDILLMKILNYYSKLYTWDLVDQFGTKLCSELVKRNFSLLETFNQWTISDDFWIRRLSLVCLIRLRNVQLSSDQWSEVEAILIQLWNDSEYYVQKAMAWCLRELSKMNSDRVSPFLWTVLSQKTKSERFSKSFIKSCIKKLPESDQESILSLL
jgi:3-methyladenine DNA glycosylase AlkD